MKYTKGTPTLLGEIEEASECGQDLYTVKSSVYHEILTESEIDAIVIKPKRNIDHLIELIKAKKREEAVGFITDRRQSTSWSFWLHMLDEYTEPRKYPVLTPDELKAVKWLVEGGYETLTRGACDYVLRKGEGLIMAYVVEASMPAVRAFSESKWITETPINLAELLEAQEDV